MLAQLCRGDFEKGLFRIKSKELTEFGDVGR